MDKSQYTIAVPLACCVLLLVRMMNGVHVKYNRTKLNRGVGAALASGFFFYASLSDTTDPYRLLHGEWWWLVVVGGGVIVTECVYLCVYRVQGRGNAMLLERIQDDG